MFSVFFFPQKLCKNYCLGLVHPLHQQAVSGELDQSAAKCVHSLVACLHYITTGNSNIYSGVSPLYYYLLSHLLDSRILEVGNGSYKSGPWFYA